MEHKQLMLLGLLQSFKQLPGFTNLKTRLVEFRASRDLAQDGESSLL